MYKFSNDLPLLVPVSIDVEELKENNKILDIDIADFKESIQYFIQDYISNNIKASFTRKSFIPQNCWNIQILMHKFYFIFY